MKKECSSPSPGHRGHLVPESRTFMESLLCSAFVICSRLLSWSGGKQSLLKGKVCGEGRSHRLEFTYFCESSASILKQLKHNGRTKSILGHAKWLIYFTVCEVCNSQRACSHYKGLSWVSQAFIMISVCAAGRCFCLLLIWRCTNFYIPSHCPARKKTSEPHFWRLVASPSYTIPRDPTKFHVERKITFYLLWGFQWFQTILINPSFLSRMGGVRWRGGGESLSLTRQGGGKSRTKKYATGFIYPIIKMPWW